MPWHVLVVGAGATGASASLRLRKKMGKEVSIQVWEKARGPGGRMSTNRQDISGCNVRADMGAQYLSLDCEDRQAVEVADMLVEAGVCADVPSNLLASTAERRGAGWRHLAGVSGGVNDALKRMLEEAGADVQTERRVASLDSQQGGWRARPFRGDPGQFDAVIVAVPGCGRGGDNLNKIRGTYESCFTRDQNRQLESVEHDDRWSYAFFLPMETVAACDKFFGDSVERVIDDDVVHLLCYQSKKTARAGGGEPEGAVAVVAHTTLAWAKRNSRSNGRNQKLMDEVAEHVGRLLRLDGSMSRLLLASKTITWFQSQVTKAVPSGSTPCMEVDGGSGGPLVLAGDYFADSSFGGCVRSGFAAADCVAAALKDTPAPSAARVTLVPNADRQGGGNGKSKGGKWQERQGGQESKKGGAAKGGGKRSKSGYGWQPYSGS